MTTVIDPSGTPSIVYNRSGTTIVSLLGGFSPQRSPNPNDPIGNDGVDIPRLSETTVLLAITETVPNSGWNMVYRLPGTAEVGDVVEVYNFSGPGPSIFPQIGEVILPSAVSDGTNNSAVSNYPSSARYRKISSNTWVAVG